MNSEISPISNRVGQEVGRTVYTLMLNQAGGIEADLTITRFFVIDTFIIIITTNTTINHHRGGGIAADFNITRFLSSSLSSPPPPPTPMPHSNNW